MSVRAQRFADPALSEFVLAHRRNLLVIISPSRRSAQGLVRN